MDDEALAERFRFLMGAYDEACVTYDYAKAAEVHRELYAVEEALRARRNDGWRVTGLEGLSLQQVVERFKVAAVEYDEAKTRPKPNVFTGFWKTSKTNCNGGLATSVGHFLPSTIIPTFAYGPQLPKRRKDWHRPWHATDSVTSR
jgi:hypothetical protein